MSKLRTWEVSYRYLRDGKIVRGGEWEFKARDTADAENQFYTAFAKAEPGFDRSGLTVQPPCLKVGNQTELYIVEQLATLSDEDLAALVDKVREYREANRGHRGH